MTDKFGFRRDTLLWLLGIAFVFGLGANAVQEIRHRALGYPLIVAADGDEARALKQTADSIMALRVAKANEPVRINSADAAAFTRLDGIGDVLSQRIVAYREQHGPFRSVDELDNVSGIGPKRLEAIRERCVVDSL